MLSHVIFFWEMPFSYPLFIIPFGFNFYKDFVQDSFCLPFLQFAFLCYVPFFRDFLLFSISAPSPFMILFSFHIYTHSFHDPFAFQFYTPSFHYIVQFLFLHRHSFGLDFYISFFHNTFCFSFPHLFPSKFLFVSISTRTQGIIPFSFNLATIFQVIKISDCFFFSYSYLNLDFQIFYYFIPFFSFLEFSILTFCSFHSLHMIFVYL